MTKNRLNSNEDGILTRQNLSRIPQLPAEDMQEHLKLELNKLKLSSIQLQIRFSEMINSVTELRIVVLILFKTFLKILKCIFKSDNCRIYRSSAGHYAE